MVRDNNAPGSYGRFTVLHADADPELVWEDNQRLGKRRRRKSAKGKLQNGLDSSGTSYTTSSQNSTDTFYPSSYLTPISESAVPRSNSAEPNGSLVAFSSGHIDSLRQQRHTTDEAARITSRRPLASLSFQEARPSHEGDKLHKQSI